MNVLMLGAGSAGSWAIRGHQLGAEMGARVTTTPTAEDWDWAEAIILVKRAIVPFGHQAKLTGKPVIWDALDFWAQPAQNTLDAHAAVALVKDVAAAAHPALIIGATEAMADAVGGVHLPHHAWPGLTASPARPRCSVVGYQGNPAYLGRWCGWVERACHARGWTFRINPDDLRDCDILVAFRDGVYDGWICREWKSGVKLVNAIAAGRPMLTQDSAAFREIAPCGSVVETPAELETALDAWAPVAQRDAAYVACAGPGHGFEVNRLAVAYRDIVQGVACPA